MAVEIGISFGDPPTIVVSGARAADADRLPAMVREVAGRAGVAVPDFAPDAADPNGVYDAEWAPLARNTIQVGARRP